MKNKFQMYIESIAILLVFTMLFSLVFALLYYFNVIQTKTFHIVSWMGGIASFGCGGFWLGQKVEKKALLNAFLMMIIVSIPSLFIAQHTLWGYVECLSKIAMYILICMYTFSKRKH